MMLSQTVEYAIRALVCLAGSSEQRLTARVIAARTGVPAGYLPKVLLVMANAHLVESRKGTGGGFNLARPAETISLLDVTHAMQGPWAEPEGRDRYCPLRRRLARAQAVLDADLASTTLADLVRDEHGRLACCCGRGCRWEA